MNYFRICCFLLLLIPATSFGQKILLDNEIKVFGFETNTGKQVVLAKDSVNHYLIYRFGTPSKIEFEFPAKDTSSWKQFVYSFYFRGGGEGNDALDLNYMAFSNKGYKYILYDTYSDEDNKRTFGIKIINQKSNKTTNVSGKVGTLVGSFSDFRDNGLLKVTEEIYD